MTCSKIPYDSKRLARQDAKLILSNQKHFSKRSHVKPVRLMRAYECRWCGKWHLTSARQK